MQKSFSHIFEGLIWRMMPDAAPDSSLWAVELRDAETKTMSVAILDLEKENVCWQGVPPGADWWMSLTAFVGGRFLLHAYRSPEIPEPNDLLAYGATDGQLIWALSNYVLVGVHNHETIRVATKSGDQIIHRQCMVESGRLLEDTGESDKQAAEIILKEPFRYKAGSPYFEKLSGFIELTTGGHRPTVIDYLEKRPFMIFSYYIYDQDKTVQHLLIVTDRRDIILHEKISEGSHGVGHSTIILKASTLVYLKNKNEFSSLTLSQ